MLYNTKWIFPRNRRVLNFYLVTTALLVAIAFVLTRYFAILVGPAMRLSLGAVPIVFAGLLLGPFYGACTGLLADAIGSLLVPQGPFHLGIMLTSMLYGLLPGLIIWAWKKLDRVVVLVSTLVCILLLSTLLQTQWVRSFTHAAYFTQLLSRIPGILLNGAALILLTQLLYPVLQNLQKRVQIWQNAAHSGTHT